MLEHLLTALLTVTTSTQIFPSTETPTGETAPFEPEEMTIEIPPQDPPQLSLRAGIAYIDGRQYDLLAPSFTISGLSVEVRYHKEGSEQRSSGKIHFPNINVQGTKTAIDVEGEERSLEHQLGFNFGWDLPILRIEKRYLRVIPSAHLNGGMVLNVTRLTMGNEELPKDIYLNFFVGLGARTRVLYPVSHLTKLPVLRGLEFGLGIGAEYRREDLRDIGSGNDNGNSYALEGYMMIVYIPDKREPTVLTVAYGGK